MKKRVEKVVKEKAAGNVEDEFSKTAGKMKEFSPSLAWQVQFLMTSAIYVDRGADAEVWLILLYISVVN